MNIKPNIDDSRLTRKIDGLDQDLKKQTIDVIEEKPLTLYLNNQEIVTMMTINDYPEYLAVGYLLNQNMLLKNDKILSIEYEEDIDTIVIRTKRKTNFEKKLKKKTLTSGCAQGTAFGDIMESFEQKKLNDKNRIMAGGKRFYSRLFVKNCNKKT